MISLECAKCGAPLQADDEAHLVECRYCHSVTRVRERTLEMPAAPTPAPAPAPAKPSPSPFRMIAVGVVLYAFASAFAFSGSLGGIWRKLRSIEMPAFASPPATSTTPAAPVASACLTDANSDAVLDVVVLRAPASEPKFFEILDGRTGDAIYGSRNLAMDARLACVAGRVVVALDDFTTRIYDPRAPQSPTTVRGSDFTRYVRAGAGCFDLESDDRQRVSVAFDGAAHGPCEATGERLDMLSNRSGIIGLTDSETTTSDGPRTVALRTREVGTPVLRLGDEKAGVHRQLRLRKCTFSAAIATSSEGLWVFGCPLGDAMKGVVVSLDRETFEERWRVPLAGSSTNHIQFFAWNGRALVLHSFGAVYALDPSDGHTVWAAL